MKLKELTTKAYNQYRSEVKGNQSISFDQAEKKLNRNLILVKETAPDRITTKGLFTTTYTYGNMKITTRFNKIVKVVNHKGMSLLWDFPETRYKELNKQLGILDCKFSKVRYK